MRISDWSSDVCSSDLDARKMTRFKKIGLLAAPALALAALSGCATSFKADVARFQQLPAPAGQSFTIVADDPRLAGGLEFSHYADLVGQRLTQTGYVAAGDPARADLIVRVAYGVDNGREKVRSTGFGAPDPFFYGGWGWRGRWGRPWGYGFYDPWLFGPGRSEEHTSELQSLMRISYAVFCLKKKKDKNRTRTT